MVEGHRAEKLGQRDFQALGHFLDGGVAEELIAVVVGVQQRQQGCRLAAPGVDEVAVLG